MKKSDEIRRRTWRMLAKNLIVLAALAVAAVVGVVSWLSQGGSTKADGLSAQTQVEDGLEFYIMPPSDSDQSATGASIQAREAAPAEAVAVSPAEAAVPAPVRIRTAVRRSFSVFPTI